MVLLVSCLWEGQWSPFVVGPRLVDGRGVSYVFFAFFDVIFSTFQVSWSCAHAMQLLFCRNGLFEEFTWFVRTGGVVASGVGLMTNVARTMQLLRMSS